MLKQEKFLQMDAFFGYEGVTMSKLLRPDLTIAGDDLFTRENDVDGI